MGADAVELTVVTQTTAKVVLPDSYIGGSTAAQRTVTSSDYDLNETLDSTTTPAVDDLMAYQLNLSGGTDTIDFTAAAIIGAESAGAPAASEDLTGKRVCHVEFECPTTNSYEVTIAPGAANPYPIFGAANDFTLKPDSKFAYTVHSNALPTISSTVKTIDITGNAADVLNLKIAFETP